MKEKEALQKVAAQLSYEFVFCGFNTLDDLESAFAAGLRDDVSAFYISGEPLLSANISRVMPLVQRRESRPSDHIRYGDVAAF